MKKGFYIFRINGIWHCHIKAQCNDGNHIMLKVCSINFRKVLNYAWLAYIEEDVSLFESLILI